MCITVQKLWQTVKPLLKYGDKSFAAVTVEDTTKIPTVIQRVPDWDNTHLKFSMDVVKKNYNNLRQTNRLLRTMSIHFC